MTLEINWLLDKPVNPELSEILRLAEDCSAWCFLKRRQHPAYNNGELLLQDALVECERQRVEQFVCDCSFWLVNRGISPVACQLPQLLFEGNCSLALQVIRGVCIEFIQGVIQPGRFVKLDRIT